MRPRAHTLFDNFLAPECAPSSPYTPEEGTIAWRSALDGYIVLEVYRRPNQTYGFRYRAWVAWRDAGGAVNGHGWWRTEPEVLVADKYASACTIAERHAASKSLRLESAWTSVV